MSESFQDSLRTSRASRRELMKDRLKGSRYLVPNLVTVGSMFCGFLAIVYSASNRFDKAVLVLGIAIVLDGLDGQVARGLKATSRFGVEFDSLSDLISFGVAPAFLLYNWCFRVVADEFGVAVCFTYIVAAATRLARFNLDSTNLKSFSGLPSPASAGTVAAFVNFYPYLVSDEKVIAISTFLALFLSLLMVSQVEFFSVKSIKLSSPLSRAIPLIVAPLIAFLWYNNKLGFISVAMAYVLSGPIFYLIKIRKERNKLRE
jgi:CDP-diacylglycerol---serine O-phosphatidyltransferase